MSFNKFGELMLRVQNLCVNDGWTAIFDSDGITMMHRFHGRKYFDTFPELEKWVKDRC